LGSASYEAGIKFEPAGFRGLFTASVFQITQQNVLTNDPVNYGYSIQDGEVRVRGLELEAKAQLTTNLDVVASYTSLDAEVTKDNPNEYGASKVGTVPAGVPQNAVSLWGYSTFRDGPLNGLGLGAGVRYVGETLGLFNAAYVAPAYTVADAMVRTGGLFNVVPLVASGSLGLGAGQIGASMALGSLFGLLATYPSGMIADRFGRKPLIVTAALITALSFFGFWFASSGLEFGVACVVWGIAAAVTGAAPAAYAADNAPPGMNATAMSMYRALSDVGYVVGPIGLGVLSDLAGPKVALAFCAIAIGSVALAFWRFAPESYRRR
jgi:hypothetical protein